MPDGPVTELDIDRFAPQDRTLGSELDALAALRLRAAGHYYRDIAQMMNCAQSTAHHRVRRGLALSAHEDASAVRAIELARLDALTVVAMEAAEAVTPLMAGTNRVFPLGQREMSVRDWRSNLVAVDLLVRIAERRAKLLGLDQQVTRVELVNPAANAHDVLPGEPDAEARAARQLWVDASRLEAGGE